MELTGALARRARDLAAPGAPAVTVITDLARAHTAWWYPGVNVIAGPPSALGHGRAVGSPQTFPAGLPVTREFWEGRLERGQRPALRRSLDLDESRFLVLLTGGGEGTGGIGRRAAAILRRFGDIDVIAVCGRNRRLERRLGRLAARHSGRLTVTGFTSDMAGLLRCCDVVVTKAGPGTGSAPCRQGRPGYGGAQPGTASAGQHREPFLLLGMGVAARHPAAGRELELPGEHGLAGGRLADRDPLPAERVNDDQGVARARYGRGPGHGRYPVS